MILVVILEFCIWFDVYDTVLCILGGWVFLSLCLRLMRVLGETQQMYHSFISYYLFRIFSKRIIMLVKT
jgi:hypothetical protein